MAFFPTGITAPARETGEQLPSNDCIAF